MLDRTDLSDYQEKSVDLIKTQKRCALFLRPGLGKTTSTLTAITEIRAFPCLVVAPLRVANDTWTKESRKWQHLRGFRIKRAVYDKRDDSADVLVVNYESLHKIRTDGWKSLVVDESTKIKNHRTRTANEVMKRANPAEYVVILSGTPVPNGITDLWTQIQVMRPNTLGKSPGEFKKWLAAQIRDGRNVNDCINEIIDPYIITKVDLGCLPNLKQRAVGVVLPHVARVRYDAVYKDLQDCVTNEKSKMHVFQRISQLRQITSGAFYHPEGENQDLSGRQYQVLHNEKMNALESLLSDGRNTLVIYQYKHELSRIMERFGDSAVLLDTKGKAIDEWNAGRIKILLAHPKSCGFGLNLQAGGSRMVFFSMDYNLEYQEQTIARLHRRGQDEEVEVVYIKGEDTLDEYMSGHVHEKNQTQRALMYKLQEDALRRDVMRSEDGGGGGGGGSGGGGGAMETIIDDEILRQIDQQRKKAYMEAKETGYVTLLHPQPDYRCRLGDKLRMLEIDEFLIDLYDKQMMVWSRKPVKITLRRRDMFNTVTRRANAAYVRWVVNAQAERLGFTKGKCQSFGLYCLRRDDAKRKCGKTWYESVKQREEASKTSTGKDFVV